MWAFAILALILPATISIPAGNSGPSQHNATNEPSLPKAIRGVRKMSPDEGEKFFWNYWYFAEPELGNITSHDDASSSIIQRSYPLRPALSVSPSAQSGNWDDGILPRDLLFPRDFKCPAGTEGCASINRPNRCCTAGDTCKLVQDTGSGDVGCCPRGEACSNEIGLCPRDYSTCSQELGGGCCIPGYGCVQGGCAHVSVITVTVHSTVMVSTATYTTPQETGTPSSSTPSIETSTTTPSTSTGDLVPPARPTSLSTAVTSESPGSVTSSGGSGMCPTGFYACSAVYQGGCCQTGRDCDTTSCPAITTRTAVSDGKTIVVPSPTLTGDSGRCAQGWFSCADTAGGGCCPTGFACGSSCAATAGSTTIAKTPPESAGRRQEEKMVWVVLMVLIAMIMNA